MTPTPWASWAKTAGARTSIAGSWAGWTSSPAPWARLWAGVRRVHLGAARDRGLAAPALPAYLFSNTLAPVIAATSLAVLDLIRDEPELRRSVLENGRYFRQAMTAAGFTLVPGEHPTSSRSCLATRSWPSAWPRGCWTRAFMSSASASRWCLGAGPHPDPDERGPHPGASGPGRGGVCEGGGRSWALLSWLEQGRVAGMAARQDSFAGFVRRTIAP